MTFEKSYPSNHWLLTMSGLLPGGEGWSMGLRLADTVPPINAAASQAVCDTYAAAVHTFWGGQSTTAAQAVLKTVKMNWLNTLGHYVFNSTSRVDYTDNAHGGGASIGYPNQVALAVTLGTAAGRGLAHQGRIFLPLPGYPVDAGTGLIQLTTAQGIATVWGGFLDTLNGLDSNRRVTIFSGGTPKTPTGAAHKVTKVEVGRVLDTMRSRRRSLVEDRQVIALASA